MGKGGNKITISSKVYISSKKARLLLLEQKVKEKRPTNDSSQNTIKKDKKKTKQLKGFTLSVVKHKAAS